MSSARPVHTETLNDGALVVATIDRQHRRNAVDHDTIVELQRAITDAQQQSVARVFMLRGAGGHFSAGADLTGVESSSFRTSLAELIVQLTTTSLVTIAQVDGSCLGAGLQLASACDLRVASETAVFGIPAAKLGVAIDQLTTDRLIELAGGGLARSILLAAEVVPCELAVARGLVNRRGTYDEAIRWAGEIALLAPLSHVAHKAAFARSADVREAIDRAWGSADSVEGRAAFAEKRPARFTGR